MSFNLNQWFADNVSEDTLFYYKGSVGSKKVTDILDKIEAIMDEKNFPLKERKKILNILIELVQNLYHHGEKFEVDNAFKSYGCIIFNDEDGGLKIVSANFIKIERLKVFTDYIDHTNSLGPNELKALYRKVLANNHYSEKGGGGLGIINMIRKSGNKLKYCSQRTEGENFFLVLTVKI
ncbi:SiaB family protein kinase [Ancylomarina sp. DW003]|nr:SiaB family protein kinase [Ancylomarina sp. DW003]MDE5422744.1 SiaB family protein kinase [Ancylomarina sp. DW003]